MGLSELIEPERVEPSPSRRRPSGLDGKRLLITGVITHNSIAFAVAERAQLEGAEVILSGFGRTRRMTERAAKRLPLTPDVLELDATNEDDLKSLSGRIAKRWDRLDGVLHAIAYAPADALGGEFLTTPADSAAQAFITSAFSMKSLAASLAPLMAPGSAIVGLDFDATIAWPVYDWMGVAKAAFESVNRYLCRDLGPLGIRSNLVSAGPIETAAASGIPGFGKLGDEWQRRAPLGWQQTDPGPVADAVCFLLSDASRAVSGEILHVDGGFHAVALSSATNL